MNFEEINIGQIIGFITGTGIIAGFLFKIFSVFNQVNQNTKAIIQANGRIDELKQESTNQKSELVEKVEETNNAVNLICSAVSALIDDSLQDNQESKKRLREIKDKLDNKKEIV